MTNHQTIVSYNPMKKILLLLTLTISSCVYPNQEYVKTKQTVTTNTSSKGGLPVTTTREFYQPVRPVYRYQYQSVYQLPYYGYRRYYNDPYVRSNGCRVPTYRTWSGTYGRTCR